MFTEEFILNITRCQGQVYSYILSLVGNGEDARDILQETNKSILEKASDYTSGTSFTAWASKIAFYKVLSFRRDAQRESLLFNETTLRDISQKSLVKSEQHNQQIDLLYRCIEKLSSERKKLLKQRYEEELPLEELSTLTGRSCNALAAMLYRVRLTLIDCVERSLHAEGAQ